MAQWWSVTGAACRSNDGGGRTIRGRRHIGPIMATPDESRTGGRARCLADPQIPEQTPRFQRLKDAWKPPLLRDL